MIHGPTHKPHPESLAVGALLTALMSTQAKSVGAKFDVAADTMYFPRELLDYRKFAFKRGVDIKSKELRKFFAAAIDAKYGMSVLSKKWTNVDEELIKDVLSPEEAARILQDYIGKRVVKDDTIASVTQHGARRKYDSLADEFIDDYADVDQSLTNYIITQTNKYKTADFFGGKELGKTNAKLAKGQKKFKQSELTTAMIGDFVGEMAKSGKIISGQVDELADILTARFVGGVSKPGKFTSDVRNILYATTLGNPIAAATQLADLGASVYLHGLTPTIKAVVSQLGKGKKMVDELGLDAIAHEAEHLVPTARFLNEALSNRLVIPGTGKSIQLLPEKLSFRAIDRFGKETLLRASLIKMNKMSDKKLADTYGKMFTPQEFQQFKEAVRRKDGQSPHTKLAMWHQLAEVQPISLSEMPQYYLQNPNLRIFYMLKTFTLKQLDLLRREVYNEIKRGNHVAGAQKMARLAMTLGVSNATVEQTRNYLQGKEMDPNDTALDAVVASLMRNYGVSQYTLDKVRQGQPITAAIEYLLPPIGILEDPIKDLVEGGERMRTVKDVPVMGKVLRNIFVEDK